MIAAARRSLTSLLLLLAAGFLLTASASSAAEKWRVGIASDNRPLTFLDRDGTPRGFAVEIMKAVAAEMHVEIEFVPMPWVQLDDAFRSGRVDVLANLSYTDERAKYIAFSSPHLTTPAAIFVRDDLPPLRNLDELRNLRVAVKTNTPAHHYLIAHGWWRQLVTSTNPFETLRAVADGRADLAVESRLIGIQMLVDGRLSHLRPSPLTFTDLQIHLHAGFHPGASAALALYNDGLARITANRTYEKLHDVWIAPLEPVPPSPSLGRYLLAATVLLALALAALAWQRRMLHRLARQKEALRSSEERLTVVLEATEDAFWDWDLRTGRVERSERWTAMLGYTPDEVAPTVEAGRALIHPEDLKVLNTIDARLSPAQRERIDAEYRMRTKSGEWRWILNRGKVVARAPDGTPLRMAGTHTDVTALRRAREEAARQALRFRFLHENIPVGLSWMRLGYPETRIVNPAYTRITGVTAEAGRQADAYVRATHPEDRARQAELERRLHLGEITQGTLEKRYIHPDGRVVWAILSIHVFHDTVAGEAHKVTTLVDISDRKRDEAEREALQAKMLEAQKLESLGVLAGGIAHDFNNLLTVILANATFARQEEKFSDARLAPIETAARRAADLCRQMLAYAGKGNVLIEQIALAELVRETAQLLLISLSKKAELHLDLPAGLPPVDADASQLRQIVMNLVINASEAIGDASGTIRLSVRRERPPLTSDGVRYNFELPAGDCLCLEVTDTGRGMTEATIQRIFDPFFTTKFTGRGLGLAAVLGIVRAHHGALTVTSEIGRGTTFRLYLPASRRAAPATAPAAAPSQPAPGVQPGTILIADDEPAVLTTVDLMLRRRGYHTALATNGDEAIQKFIAAPDSFAAVILDLTMPGRDGAEVLATIRAERAYSRVLVMSGFGEADIIERLRGCGEVVILRKPFTQESLLDRLAATLAPQE